MSGTKLYTVKNSKWLKIAWYLVPIFFGILGGMAFYSTQNMLFVLFGILGGLICYFSVDDEDGKMAKNLLVLGIIWSFVVFVIVAELLVVTS